MRIVYIDESGTIGLKVSEPYFVIAAIIFDNERALKRAKNLVKRTKVQISSKTNRPIYELKGSELNMPQKQKILQNLSATADYRVAYIVVEKAKLAQKLYQHKNVTYNYLFGVLMKNILASCNEDVRIISDNRTTKVTSASSLCDYVRAKAYGDWKFGYDITIEQAESHVHYGLQVADIVANSIFARYNLGVTHLYDIHQRHYMVRECFPFQSLRILTIVDFFTYVCYLEIGVSLICGLSQVSGVCRHPIMSSQKTSCGTSFFVSIENLVATGRGWRRSGRR